MISLDEFRALPHAISLLGMSGVGKTTLSKALRQKANWFHYSADYRIGTRYLAEPILDNIKYKIMVMDDQFVADLLRSDSIFIAHNISVDNLEPVSTFLGMYGDPAEGGLDKAEFLRRQELYRQAEIASMQDVPHFIARSWNIYGCRNFINDASGSLCEIAKPGDPDDPVIQALISNSLLLYIQGDAGTEEALKERARSQPKPLYYNSTFIGPRLQDQPDDGAGVNAIEFARPLFPKLLEFRKPRYQDMADRFGISVEASDLFGPRSNRTPSPDEFLNILYDAILRDVRDNPHGAETLNRYLASCERRISRAPSFAPVGRA